MLLSNPENISNARTAVRPVLKLIAYYTKITKRKRALATE
jgi:hypothetical protein